jgi:methyl-galactoside transport system substrate-binding protein
MKKILQLLLLLTGILLLFGGCTDNYQNNKTKLNQIRIGVTVYQMEDPFISMIPAYIEKNARAMEISNNMKISLNILDAKGDQSLQNDQVDKFIAQKYNAICVNMVDRTAASVIIDRAKAANIPVVFFNREPVEEDMKLWDKLYYVCSLASESGILEGGIVADTYRSDPQKWDKNADGKLQYVILEGEQGHQDSLIRTEVTIKTIRNAGIEIEKLSNRVADWQRGQAGVITSQWLKEFDNKIEMIISNNDNMALGAIDAYKEAGIFEFPIIVGIDAIPPALEAVKNGEMAGTVLNDAKAQGKAIFDLAFKLSQGEPAVDHAEDIKNRYIWIPHSAVTIDNVDDIISEMLA